MNKLLVFPFTLDTAPIARFRHLLAKYDSIIPVVEEAAAFTSGMDVSCVDGGSYCGLAVTTDFESSIADASGVLFSSIIMSKETMQKNISIAKEHGKKLYICGGLADWLEDGLEDTCCLDYPPYSLDVVPEDRLFEIPVPVIIVTGQGQQCGKFDIQLGLRQKFVELGYKVSQIGTKRYSALFGIHALPMIPYAPLWEKIILYNRFFKSVVDKEKPDVLIVGIPGGIMPLKERHNELFGETAIAISKSIHPDISILSMYYGKIDRDYLSNTMNYAKYALDSQFGFFHLSNTKLVVELDLRTISYLTTDSSKVFEEQDIIDDRFFNVYSAETSTKVYENIISKLQNNIERY